MTLHSSPRIQATLNQYDPPPKVARDDWPSLNDEALCGLAGDIVRTISPHTEADPVAILAHLLAAFANAAGSSPHWRVEFREHQLRIFVCLVGESSKGRKGTAWSTIRYMLRQVDSEWESERVTAGLSSGEGLIFHVRDEKTKKDPIRKDGRVVEYQDVIEDPGVTDKRLLIVEEEFSSVLKQANRDGNILSATIREAWDSGNLHPLTKTNPVRATGAHISIIGHITTQELLRYLNDTERANGFANRFIWLLARRSRPISNPTGTPQEALDPVIKRLQGAISNARKVGLMKRDSAAEAAWSEVYEALSEGRPGLLGQVLGRAEAQVMRLACIYALLDESSLVTLLHLKAALAFWEYAEASAKRIFGDRVGEPTADRILEAIRESEGLSETDIYSTVFGRNKPSREIDKALKMLARAKLVTSTPDNDTGGRPRTLWRATY